MPRCCTSTHARCIGHSPGIGTRPCWPALAAPAALTHRTQAAGRAGAAFVRLPWTSFLTKPSPWQRRRSVRAAPCVPRAPAAASPGPCCWEAPACPSTCATTKQGSLSIHPLAPTPPITRRLACGGAGCHAGGLLVHRFCSHAGERRRERVKGRGAGMQASTAVQCRQEEVVNYAAANTHDAAPIITRRTAQHASHPLHLPMSPHRRSPAPAARSSARLARPSWRGCARSTPRHVGAEPRGHAPDCRISSVLLHAKCCATMGRSDHQQRHHTCTDARHDMTYDDVITASAADACLLATNKTAGARRPGGPQGGQVGRQGGAARHGGVAE